MNKKQWNLLIRIIIVSFMCGAYYYANYGSLTHQQRAMTLKQHVCEPFDIYQLQSFLAERIDPTTGKPYYTGEIDGWCGRGTIKGWNRYCNDRQAIAIFEGKRK